MNAYLHAELQRIDDLVNDVEMQVNHYLFALIFRSSEDCLAGTSLRRAYVYSARHKHRSAPSGGYRSFCYRH